jgi:hypothetical protein
MNRGEQAASAASRAGTIKGELPRYLAGPARTGRWLRWRFDLNGLSILEIAGGSCRDSRYLHASGLDAVGSDGDAETISQVREHLTGSGFGPRLEDAAALSFPDRSFDVVFHNGLWVVFPADDQIRLLLNEQLRVTRRYGVAIVHNALNRRLVDRFASLAKTDPLYSIRFFTPEQIRELVRPCLGPADRLSIEKFGGPADHGYGIQRRAPGIGAAAAALPPRLYRFQPWSVTERIAVVIDRGARR